MPDDHIRYDFLAQEALRGVVRTVLADVSEKGLPGEHHFKITFATPAPGVRLSERMRAQYPETMTIILQHQFWDLVVRDEAFEVGLSFGGVPERWRCRSRPSPPFSIRRCNSASSSIRRGRGGRPVPGASGGNAPDKRAAEIRKASGPAGGEARRLPAPAPAREEAAKRRW